MSGYLSRYQRFRRYVPTVLVGYLKVGFVPYLCFETGRVLPCLSASSGKASARSLKI